MVLNAMKDVSTVDIQIVPISTGHVGLVVMLVIKGTCVLVSRAY